MKELLIESYRTTKRMTGIDPSKPLKIREIITDDTYFDIYKQALMEGLKDEDKPGFSLLAENTRQVLLENSMFGLSPYETLALPLLRVFYPRTIAKELVTTIPMDKPEIVRGFIRATFHRFGDSNAYNGPSNTDISGGPSIGVPVLANADCPGTTDVLAVAGLSKDVAHIEKTFKIRKVIAEDAGGDETLEVDVTPTVDGEFSFSVEFTVQGSDVVTGRINLHDGVLECASVNGTVDKLQYEATVSLEENTINPRVTFAIDKLRLFAKDRQISTEWSIQMEQDVKALFNVSIQAELVSTIGQQIVLDIDREIVNSLIYAAEKLAGASHTDTFSKTPPANYTWGNKQWLENVIPVMNTLSAQVYNDTNISAANVIACNPLDATVFESLQDFRYSGHSTEDGDLGYESATISHGKWKVLVSNVVPKGKSIMIYKPTEELKAVYIFAPYVPAVLSPYPLGSTPSLTVLSRYGTQLVRPNGIAVLNITN